VGDHAGALAQGDNGIGPNLLRPILRLRCYPFRDEAIQLSVGECLQPWTILFLNHSHGEMGSGSQLAKVVNVANWSDANRNRLEPHEPEPTNVVVTLGSKH
jgi:hypothetical protein